MSSRSGIICAGNWIVDLIHDIEHFPAESELARINTQSRGIGGGAANVVAALAKLDTGIPLWPMGAVGDDDYGDFILKEVRALGLPTDRLKIKTGIATAHTHVMSVPGRSRTFFYQGGANDVLAPDDFPTGTFANTPARLFYLGYLTLLGELDEFDSNGKTGAAWVLQRAQNAGMITCVDLVSLMHPGFQQIFESGAPFIDYLVLNEIEAARATGHEFIPGEASKPNTLSDVATALIRQGVCKAVVVHCAERVAWCDAGGTPLIVDVSPLPPDDIVSTLGAGDAFCAGLLYAIHEGWTPDRAITLAIATAKTSLRGHTATSAIPTLASLRLNE